MSVLFLDDCDERAIWARRHLSSGGEFIHVRTAADAIAALASQSWDMVYLDHDLDGQAWQDWRGPNTGTAVVRWILLNMPTIGRIVVHSMNTPNGNRMATALSRKGYAAEYKAFLDLVNDVRRQESTL